MNRKAFFDLAKASLFGGRLTVQQVDGMDAILDACERHGVTDIDHVAHVLAHVRRETGGYMLGIKETVMPHHADKNPSDATVIARLDNAWAKGALGKVSRPYWRDGAFGRGPIQITHWGNYEKFGKRLGVPLRTNPSLALDPKIGADIAVVGMKEGLFRKVKLSDFKFPEALRAPPDKNPRRIVNGKDGSDQEVAASHRLFVSALRGAGYGEIAAAARGPTVAEAKAYHAEVEAIASKPPPPVTRIPQDAPTIQAAVDKAHADQALAKPSWWSRFWGRA